MAETTTNPHRLVAADDPERITGARIVCDAPEGSPCRMWCDEEECEEYTSDDHASHALRDQGYCIRTEGWFDDGVEDYFDGDVLPLLPLRSGPVDLSWNGNWMVWSYATESEVQE